MPESSVIWDQSHYENVSSMNHSCPSFEPTVEDTWKLRSDSVGKLFLRLLVDYDKHIILEHGVALPKATKKRSNV